MTTKSGVSVALHYDFNCIGLTSDYSRTNCSDQFLAYMTDLAHELRERRALAVGTWHARSQARVDAQAAKHGVLSCSFAIGDFVLVAHVDVDRRSTSYRKNKRT